MAEPTMAAMINGVEEEATSDDCTRPSDRWWCQAVRRGRPTESSGEASSGGGGDKNEEEEAGGDKE